MRKILLYFFFISYSFGYFDSIGKVTALIGNAEIIRNKKIILVKLGTQINKKDIIETTNGKIQILFQDNTIITLNKNTKIKILDYFFDNTSESKFLIYLTKGNLQILTGKIAKLTNKNFKVLLNNSKILIKQSILIIKKHNILNIEILKGYTIFNILNSKNLYTIHKSEKLIYNPIIKYVKITQGLLSTKEKYLSIKNLNKLQNTLSNINKINNDAINEEKNDYTDVSSSSSSSSFSDGTSSSPSSSSSSSSSP